MSDDESYDNEQIDDQTKLAQEETQVTFIPSYHSNHQIPLD